MLSIQGRSMNFSDLIATLALAVAVIALIVSVMAMKLNRRQLSISENQEVRALRELGLAPDLIAGLADDMRTTAEIGVTMDPGTGMTRFQTVSFRIENRGTKTATNVSIEIVFAPGVTFMDDPKHTYGRQISTARGLEFIGNPIAAIQPGGGVVSIPLDVAFRAQGVYHEAQIDILADGVDRSSSTLWIGANPDSGAEPPGWERSRVLT
jgi:hypothetical protein